MSYGHRHEKLIPSGEALTNPDELTKILAHAKAEGAVWETVAAKLGDEELDDLVVVAGMLPTVINTAMGEAGVNPVIRVKIPLIYSLLRAKFGMVALDPSAQLQDASHTAAALAAGHEKKPDKIRVRDYSDQGRALRCCRMPAISFLNFMFVGSPRRAPIHQARRNAWTTH